MISSCIPGELGELRRKQGESKEICHSGSNPKVVIKGTVFSTRMRSPMPPCEPNFHAPPLPLLPDSGCQRGQMWGSRMPAGLRAGTRGWESHSGISSRLALSSLRAHTLEPDCPSSNLRSATFFQCDTGQVFNLSEPQFPHGGRGDDNCRNCRSCKHKASDMVPAWSAVKDLLLLPSL